jgi:hypothetical protein
MFADLDALIRNGAAQEPIIVAPAPVPARTATGCRLLPSRNVALARAVVAGPSACRAGRLRSQEPVTERRVAALKGDSLPAGHANYCPRWFGARGFPSRFPRAAPAYPVVNLGGWGHDSAKTIKEHAVAGCGDEIEYTHLAANTAGQCPASRNNPAANKVTRLPTRARGET